MMLDSTKSLCSRPDCSAQRAIPRCKGAWHDLEGLNQPGLNRSVSTESTESAMLGVATAPMITFASLLA